MKHKKTHIVLFQYFVSVCILLVVGNTIFAQGKQKKIDSLKAVYSTLDGVEKIQTLDVLSRLISPHDFSDAIYYDSLALQEAVSIKDSVWMSSILIDLGYLYLENYNYNLSHKMFKQAYLISKQSNEKLQLFKCYKALGNYNYKKNIYDSSLFYHYEALKIIEKVGDTLNLAKTLNNIGIVHFVLGDDETAIDYYKSALNLKLEFGDTSNTFLNYYNIGLIHNANNRNDKAIHNFLKAIEVAKKYEDERLPYAYNGLSQIYIRKNDIKEAEKYLKKSLKYSKEINDKLLVSRNYFYLAKFAVKNKQYNEALKNLKFSQNIAKELTNKQRVKNNYKLYAKIFEAQNLYDSAYFYQKRYSALEDSIYNEKLSKNLANIQLNKQREESQKVIAQKDENITQKTKLSRLLAVVLILSVLLIVIITRNYIQSNKINRRLKESKEEIERQKERVERRNNQLADAQTTIENQNTRLKNANTELENAVQDRTHQLEQSNLKLEKAVKDLDDFIYRTSHDLRGPIATMQGIIQIGLMEKNMDQVKNYFHNLQSISDMANVKLHKLIEVHKMYLKQPVLEKINIENLLNEALAVARTSDIDNHIDLNVELNANGNWVSDKDFFKMIIENMITNAYLFSLNNRSFIKIQICEQSPYLKMVFEDNGFGIQEEDKDKVFDVFFKGTPTRSGTGLEIYAARLAVEKLKGRISLASPRNNTIYEVTLPSLQG